MGATLTLAEFRGIMRRPHGVGFVLVLQYLLAPLLALVLARVLNLSPGITVGMMLVAALPSGSLSNIYAYIGKGNVPLSITATTASTVGCLLLTPLVLRIFQPPGLPDDFQMPVGKILTQITTCLLIPLAIGMAIGHRWPRGRRTVSKWCIRGCMCFLAILIVGSLRSGRLDVFQFGLKEPAALILFGFILLGPVQILANLLGFSKDDAFTIGIESTMRNCNAGILLKVSIWPVTAAVDPIGSGVLYAVMFYGGMTLFLCMAPVIRRTITRRIRTARKKPDGVDDDRTIVNLEPPLERAS
jgi:BASS family bile acid:Na+ symporter